MIEIKIYFCKFSDSEIIFLLRNFLWPFLIKKLNVWNLPQSNLLINLGSKTSIQQNKLIFTLERSLLLNKQKPIVNIIQANLMKLLAIVFNPRDIFTFWLNWIHKHCWIQLCPWSRKSNYPQTKLKVPEIIK